MNNLEAKQEVLTKIGAEQGNEFDYYIVAKHYPNNMLKLIEDLKPNQITTAQKILKATIDALKCAIEEGGFDINQILNCITKLNEKFDFNQNALFD